MGLFSSKKNNKKSNSNKGSKWRDFQNKVGIKSEHLDGMDVETQKVLPDGKRPDYYGKGFLGQRVVGDAKNVKTLTKKHIDQVINYRKTSNADKGFVAVKKGTKISSEVKEYAKQKGIAVSKMASERKKGFNGFGFFNLNDVNEKSVTSGKRGTGDFGMGSSLTALIGSDSTKKPKKKPAKKKSTSKKKSTDAFGMSASTSALFGSSLPKKRKSKKKSDDWSIW